MAEEQYEIEFKPPAETLRELWTPDDIYKNCNDATIRAFGEDRRVERKRAEVNPRNPNLMWAMYYFDFVQCAYEGTRRMRLGMQEANLPDPIFTQRESGVFQVSVTLKNNVEHRKNFVRHEAMPSMDPLVYESLSTPERMLVNWCADGRRITVKDAQDVLGDMASDWRAARAALDSLTKKFVFDRPPGKDRDRHRKWFLRKKTIRRSKKVPE